MTILLLLSGGGSIQILNLSKSTDTTQKILFRNKNPALKMYNSKVSSTPCNYSGINVKAGFVVIG